MISDTLFEAVKGIEEYLNNPDYDEMYEGDLRKRIVALVTQMDAMRQELDQPPVPE